MPLQSCADTRVEVNASATNRTARTTGRSDTTTPSILSSGRERIDILRAMQSPSMRRVFVTGGTRFVGRAVVQALRPEGCAVRSLVQRGSAPAPRGLGAIERLEGGPSS